uniref:Uncharacterized protein n=1 Tax=Lactuca sativa TaxID=4236 RepID=A0A9R1VVM4_LACSA|nr:hypothetical protein LSAT_V11C400159280 [Lactuca sativa]
MYLAAFEEVISSVLALEREGMKGPTRSKGQLPDLGKTGPRPGICRQETTEVFSSSQGGCSDQLPNKTSATTAEKVRAPSQVGH